MALDTSNISVKNNQLVISSFKPKPVELFGREHLERFREAAEATGIGLDWPVWRWSVELGSKLFKELLAKGALTEDDVQRFHTEMGIMPIVKKEVINPDLQKLQEFAAKLGFSLSKGSTTTSTTSTAPATTATTAGTTTTTESKTPLGDATATATSSTPAAISAAQKAKGKKGESRNLLL